MNKYTIQLKLIDFKIQWQCLFFKISQKIKFKEMCRWLPKFYKMKMKADADLMLFWLNMAVVYKCRRRICDMDRIQTLWFIIMVPDILQNFTKTSFTNDSHTSGLTFLISSDDMTEDIHQSGRCSDTRDCSVSKKCSIIK